MSDTAVSIICMTYNQENYIAKALDGFLMQETTFPFEVIVHDDCSTDQTAAIVRDYEARYPEIIRPIYETQNQYSQGTDIVMGLCIPRAKGRYIAICEGDDFWTDKQKLQMQYEILEQHPELSMCVCGASEVRADDELVIQEIRPKKEDAILTAEEVILGGGRYVATATHFYRRELFASQMNFEKILNFDYSNQIKGALFGGIYYLDRNMASYRSQAQNSWTNRLDADQGQHRMHIQKEKEMLLALDEETEGRYHQVITQRLGAYVPFYDQLLSKRDEIRANLASVKGGIFLWGLGKRGDAIQRFCRTEGIELNGVCDKREQNISERTPYGFVIVETKKALADEDNAILASNTVICESLKESGFGGKLIDFQKYMPLT